MVIDIDPSIDSDFVYQVSITYVTGGTQREYITTINLHQKEVSINRGIKSLKLENVTKAIIKPLQKLSRVNYKN